MPQDVGPGTAAAGTGTDTTYRPEHLEDVAPLDLPTDRPRPPEGPRRSAQLPFQVGPDLHLAAVRLARDTGGATFDVLLAGYQALLMRHTGQDAFYMGAVGPAGEGHDTAASSFTTALPVRSRASETLGFAALVQQTHAAMVDARSRGHARPARLADGGEGRDALIRSTLALHPRRDATPPGDAATAPVPDLARPARQDLRIDLWPDEDGGLRGRATYSADLFDADTIGRMCLRFTVLLEAALADPDTPVRDLPALTGEERDLLDTWNRTERDLPDVTLLDLIQAQDPRSVAVRSADRRLTYGALLARARAVARHLTRYGVGSGSLVAVCLDRDPDMLAALVGVAMCGAAYLPIDPRHPPARNARIVADSGAHLVLAGSSVRFGDVPALPLADALADDDDFRCPRVSPSSPAYVLYTSGSTGTPKGVVVPHRALTNLLLWASALLDSGPDHVWLALTSLSFDISALELFLPLVTGGSCVVAADGAAQDADAVAGLVRAHGVTHVQATPSGWRLLLDGDFPPVTALCGGEVLPVRLARRLRSRTTRLINVYGPTETTIWSTAWDVPETFDEVSIGRPIDNTTTHVLDAAGRWAPIGVPGHLHIGGAGLAHGYLGRPGRTAERFVPDPYGRPGARLYRTGDLAKRSPDGRLVFLGRTDHQVKLRGHRVELGEVEAVIEEHPSVRQAVAAMRGERLVAFLVGSAGHVRDHLERRLPAFMVPSDLIEVDSLPLTPNGKVDRLALPDAPAREPRASGVPGGRPDGSRWDGWAEHVARVFADVLELGTVGTGDDFFRLGGTSLTSAAAVAALRRSSGLDVPSHAVFTHRTPARLAEWLADEARPVDEAHAGGAAEYPLSPLQYRLWLAHRLDPRGTAYTVPVILDIDGELDPEALRGALDDMVRRHPTLRSVISAAAETPVARVLDAGVELTIVACDDPERDPATDAFLRRPFDLTADPPLRAMLLGAGRRHRLVLAIHHLAVDGDSVEILLADLAAFYTARLHRTPPPAPASRLDFGDASRRAHETPSAVLERQVAFWARYLDGMPPTRLPLDSGSRGAGAQHVRSLPPGTRHRVETVARRHGTTSFVVLLAAFGALLRRWSGQEDVCVGVPVSRREGPGLDRVVGFFVNTVAVRVDMRDDPAFSGLVQRLGHQWADVQANLDVPFELVLDRTGRPVPFTAWFNHLGAPARAPVMPRVRTRLSAPPSPPAVFDLNMYLTDDGERIETRLVYDTAACSAEMAETFLAQYELLVRDLVAAPATGVLKPPLSPAEPSPPGTAAIPAAEAVGVLAERVGRGSGAVADGSVVRTAPKVLEGARRLAAAIHAAVPSPGGTVAVLAARSVLLPEMLLGVWLAGCRYALLDPDLPIGRQAACLRPASPDALLFTRAHEETAAAIADRLAVGGARVPLLRAEDADRIPPKGRAAEPTALGGAGYLAFTSGTTSGPKAVVAAPGPLVHFLDWYCHRFQLGPGDRFAFLSALGHDPLHRDVFAPLWVGGSLHVPARAVPASSAESLVNWLAAEAITVANLTPQHLRLVVSAAMTSDADLSRLRVLCVSGDVVTSRDISALSRIAPQATVVIGYGATETPQLASCRVVGVSDAEDWAARRGPYAPLPLAAGAPGTELVVTTPAGHRAAVGEVGEIVVRGRHLASGYLDDALTRERFVPDEAPGVRRFRTGDAGRPLPDGTIEFLGRLDDDVKVRGHRVAPAEVDAALGRHPRVRACITLGRPVGQEIELVSYITTTDGAPLGLADIRSFLAPHLASHALPTLAMHLDDLQLSGNGKIDRNALPEPGPRRPAPRSAPVRFLGDLERVIGEVWSAVLDVEAVRPDDAFFDLGGTSARLASVHAMLRERLGTSLPLLALYEHPTVRDLADHLRGGRPEVGGPRRARTGDLADERRRRLVARRRI